MHCPKCGFPVKDRAKFCGKCGYKLQSVEVNTLPKRSVERSAASHIENHGGRYQGSHRQNKNKSSAGNNGIILLCLLIIALVGSLVFLIPEVLSSSNAGQFAHAQKGGRSEASQKSQKTDKNPGSKINVEIDSASNFSEGMAWVRYSDPQHNIEDEIGLLSTSGEIITNTFLCDIDTFGSDFSDGYAYVNRKNGEKESFVILDKEGNVTAENPEDGNSYCILAGGDGIFFVLEKIRNINENEDYYGFIKADGTWIVAPTSNNPLHYGYQEAKACGGQLSFYYLGENVFLSFIGDYLNKYAYYNVATGAATIYEEEDSRGTYIACDGKPYQYSNGYTLSWDADRYTNSNVYAKDASGKTVWEMKLPVEGWGSEVKYSEGIFFTGVVKFVKELVIEDGAFYNLRGNKLIDFSEYTVVMSDAAGFYEFHNGIAAVKILGADGEYYICHIDLNGNLLYEPIKIYHAINCAGNGNAAGTAMYIAVDDYSNQMVLNADGSMHKIAVNLELYNEKAEGQFVFSDGYAWSENNQCFIGVDGEKLITYLYQS